MAEAVDHAIAGDAECARPEPLCADRLVGALPFGPPLEAVADNRLAGVPADWCCTRSIIAAYVAAFIIVRVAKSSPFLEELQRRRAAGVSGPEDEAGRVPDASGIADG